MRDGFIIRSRNEEEWMENVVARFITLPIYNSQRSKKDKVITFEDVFTPEEYEKRFKGAKKKPTEKEIYEDFFE